MKDFHLPQHSRSVFSRIGVVPAHQIHCKQKAPTVSKKASKPFLGHPATKEVQNYPFFVPRCPTMPFDNGKRLAQVRHRKPPLRYPPFSVSSGRTIKPDQRKKAQRENLLDLLGLVACFSKSFPQKFA